MTKKQPAITAATVATEVGCAHIYCPSCDRKIQITNIVSWYMGELLGWMGRTGRATRLKGFGSLYRKRNATRLVYRADKIAAAKAALNTKNTKPKTENRKTKQHGNER